MSYCANCGGNMAEQLRHANAQLSLAQAQIEQANARLNQVSAENGQLARQISDANRRIDRNDARANERIDCIYQALGYIIGIGLAATGVGLVALQVMQLVSRTGG